ncbi:MAG: FAD-binding oxidoreductase [Ahrensia sp.]|nr:FAD-binding oxidoreductase [Ahrensia sp.]
MPKSHSDIREFDETLFKEWEALGPEVFHVVGLSKEQIEQAQKELEGYIVLPGQKTYFKDRMLSNPKFSEAPCMIVYCKSENDVRIALKLVTFNKQAFTVRSGGHCTAGFSAGSGILIDLRKMDGIHIDREARTVTVDAGVAFGDLNKRLEDKPNYWHVPGGECEGVCIGGYVQGGGIGFTSGAFGMNCDNVLEMRVMLYDGSVVVANRHQNRDLLWAMCGGTGGNFGVLLTVKYELRQVKQVAGVAHAYPMETKEDLEICAQILDAMHDYVGGPGELYDDAATFQALMVYQNKYHKNDSDKPLFPVFMLRMMYAREGDVDPATLLDDAKALMERFKRKGCIVQIERTGTYREMLKDLLDDPQEQPVITSMPYQDKASRLVTKKISETDWIDILSYFKDQTPNKMSYMYLEYYGGAIRSAPEGENAFVHRQSAFDAVMDVFWYKPDEREAAEVYLQGWINLMEKHWDHGVYQNYASLNVPNYVVNYWGHAAPDLFRVKKKYDPGDNFTFAQEIRYASAEELQVAAPYKINFDISRAINAQIDYAGGAAPGEHSVSL